MFGKFIDYAKQRGSETSEHIICQMFKKNSNDIKSRNWRLPVDAITIVEDYGQMKGVDAMREDAAFLKSVNKFAFSITIFIDF